MTKKEQAELKRLRALEEKERKDAELKLQALMAKDDCPHCGRCKECGRSDRPNYVPVPYYPQPWPRPYWYVDYTSPPYVTYTDNTPDTVTQWKATTGGTFEANSSSTILLNDGRGQ